LYTLLEKEVVVCVLDLNINMGQGLIWIQDQILLFKNKRFMLYGKKIVTAAHIISG